MLPLEARTKSEAEEPSGGAMKATYRCLTAPLLAFLLATTAGAQAPLGKAATQVAWRPVVGAGAAYVSEDEVLGKMEVEIAVVGTETVGGKTGYWLEQIAKNPRYGEARSKILYVGDGHTLQIKKMFTQQPNGPLTEVPKEFLEGNKEQEEPEPVLLGTETITTPAGTFVCQHYRTKEKKAEPEEFEGPKLPEDIEDFWVSEKVTPFGIVKMRSKGRTLILARLIANAQPRIKGTPQKPDSKEGKEPR